MKLWGGRFSKRRRDPDFEKFAESFSLDQRLVLYDLRVNRAFVRALRAAAVLKPAESRKLTLGLDAIHRDVSSRAEWAARETGEDIHTWVEARLAREVGELAGKLRTGRSRNDLVATEMRLFVTDAVRELQQAMGALLDALVARAAQHSDTVLPGFTHLQPAQPILFGHYLLAYFEMLRRDFARLEDCRNRANELPLGAGALSGTAFPIDREALARELGFATVSRNSLDATADRDFVCEMLFDCALTMTHLSRLAEDLLIYSTPAFGFVEIDEAYSTGSSLMPQKRNADALELIRGKAARVQGKLSSVLTLLKGLPLGYDRDLQEDKHALFDGFDTTRDSVVIAARIIRTLRVNPDRMQAATQLGFLTATDIADELVHRGVPFAAAHERVGSLVRYCAEHGKSFADLTDSEAARILPEWDQAMARLASSPLQAVRSRRVQGGTAPEQVARQIRLAKATVEKLKRGLSNLES
ncbi:MAG TPA: argininosuccinate lyase [Terriglobia bacterium]|nr:argininosuccinate lyase [Terriglobia bacterium]